MPNPILVFFFKKTPPIRGTKPPIASWKLERVPLNYYCVLEWNNTTAERKHFLFRRVDIQVNIKNTYNDHGGASSFSMALVNQHFHEKIEKNSWNTFAIQGRHTNAKYWYAELVGSNMVSNILQDILKNGSCVPFPIITSGDRPKDQTQW